MLEDELEVEARQRSQALEEAGRLPAGFTAQHYPLTRNERIGLQRLKLIWDLAGSLDALEDLLLGVPVDPSRLNKDELAGAFEASLVQLVRPIDLLHGRVG